MKAGDKLNWCRVNHRNRYEVVDVIGGPRYVTQPFGTQSFRDPTVYPDGTAVCEWMDDVGRVWVVRLTIIDRRTTWPKDWKKAVE